MMRAVFCFLFATTLLPYIYARSEYRLMAYIVAATIILWSISILLLSPQRIRLALRIAQQSPHFLLYCALIFINQSISMLLNSELNMFDYVWALGYIIMGLISYFLFPVFIVVNKLFRTWLAFLISIGAISSAIAIYVAFTGASKVLGFHIRQVQPYTPLGIYTTSSIFFESNRFAISAFFGLLGSLYFLKERRYVFIGIITSLLCLSGIIISWSRALYLGSVLGISAWLITRVKPSQRSQIFVLLGVLIILGVLIVTAIDPINEALFALGMGGREIYWPAAVKIISQKPLLGYGFGRQEIVESMLFKYTSIATSIHSTPLSIAFYAGIPVAVLYLAIIFVSLKRLFKSRLNPSQKSVILGGVVTSSIAAFFLDYIPGGLSYGTIIYTVFLGLANVSFWLHYNTDMEASNVSKN